MPDDALEVDDIKKFRVSSTTLGFVLSLTVVVATVVWQAAAVQNRIGDIEAQVHDLSSDVAVIEANTGTDSSILAALDEIRDGVNANDKAISDLSAARLRDLERFTPSWTFDVYADLVDVMSTQLDGIAEQVAGIAPLDDRIAAIEDQVNSIWEILDE